MAEKHSAKTTPGPRSKNPRKAPKRRKESAGKGGDEPPPVLAAARGSIPLAEVGVKALKTRKVMTGGVVLEFSDDQKREKAAALAAQLTRILNPGKVRVAAPFRAAEASVVGIDISVTKEELREILGKGWLQGGGRPSG